MNGNFRRSVFFGLSAAGFATIGVWILFLLLLARGFGSSAVFRLTVGGLLGFVAFSNLLRKDFEGIGRSCICFVASLLFWPLVYLYGFWVFAIGVDPTNKQLRWHAPATAFLFLWILQFTEIGSWTYFPCIGIPIFLLICVCMFFSTKPAYIILAIICIVASIIDLASLQKENVEIAYHKDFASGYVHGPILARILNGKLVDPNNVGGDISITSLIQGSGANTAKRPIIVVDHGQKPSKNYPAIVEGDIIQKPPWTGNQFFGDQYLLAAIAQDGQWVSNIGGRLRAIGKMQLVSPCHQNGKRYEPLVLRYKNTTYVNDSDPFVDRLANYQVAGIREMAYGVPLYRIINILFLIGAILSVKFKYSDFATGFIVILFVAFYILIPTNGDIRIIGKMNSPHEPSKLSGVLRSLADAGFSCIKGGKNCNVLVIGEKKIVAPQKTERVILACSGSTINLGEQKIGVGEIPLGMIDGIVDARNLSVSGVMQGPILKIGEVTVIGTDSPAKQDWKRWLR